MAALRIGWWNTSLNPPRVREIHAKSPSAVYAGLLCLLDRVDLLFLGETLLSDKIAEVVTNYNVSQPTLPLRRTFRFDTRRTGKANNRFRTMCLYDASRVSCTPDCLVDDWFNLAGDDKSKHYRVGQRYDFNLPNPIGKTSFYVVHWSQYSEEDGEAMKLLAAHQLRSNMDGYSDNRIVCLGDFNCEPPAKAMAALGASRSIEYVERRGGFFNGFWKLQEYGSIESENTRFMKTTHPLFDQILLNKALIVRQGGRFECEILENDVYHPLDGEHRPVVVTL